MERSGNFYKAIRLGYILISILIGCMDKLLKEMGCTPQEIEEGRIKFEYQGIFFLMEAINECKFINLIWPWFHSFSKFDIDEFARVRQVVNDINAKGSVSVIYGITDSDDVAVHIKKNLLLVPQIPDLEDYMKLTLDSFFRTARTLDIEIEKCRFQVYVFSSHFHEDHFTREIFEWRKQKENITYILSKDILKHRRASKEEADAWLAKGVSWSDELVSVKALGSTDSGVSWIVETEGKRFFHAGDLNNWYARFLPEAVPGQTIYSEEFEEDIDPIAHEKHYLGELKDIRKVTDSFDLVMFPIDGRIGNGYTLGGRQFIERFKVGMFVPMHFVASGFESSWRMKEFTDEKFIPFWEITKEGETIEL